MSLLRSALFNLFFFAATFLLTCLATPVRFARAASGAGRGEALGAVDAVGSA